MFKYGDKIIVTQKGFYEDQRGIVISYRQAMYGKHPVENRNIIEYLIKLPFSDIWISELNLEEK